MSVELDSKELKYRFLSDKDFEIYPDDLEFIFCDGKRCDPTICLRTSCKVFEYWRNKKDG